MESRSRLLMVSGVLLAMFIGGYALATRSPQDEPASLRSSEAPNSDLDLSRNEALLLFEELDADRRTAIEDRDFLALRSAFHPDGPALRRVSKSIRQLLKDDVRPQFVRYEAVQSRLTRLDEHEMRIRQVVLVDIAFLNSEGIDTSSGDVERQVLATTLRPFNGEWRFYDGKVLRAKRVNGV